MRPSTRTSLVLLAAVAVAQAAPSRVNVVRQSVQCAATDKSGTPLSSSQGGDDLVTCTYGSESTGGAGPCQYFPANGSFSSGSSQCPAGIAQDASATTDGLSIAGGAASSTATSTTVLPTDPNTTSGTLPISVSSTASLPATSSTLPVQPGTSSTSQAPSSPSSSSGSTPVSSSGSTIPSPSPSPSGNAAVRAHGLVLGASASHALVVLGALVVGAWVL